VVGYSITPSYLAKHPFLKFAKGPGDTGVIASWNIEAPTVDGTNPVILPEGIAINPITWTRKQTTVPAAKNAGSIELDPATDNPVLTANGKIKRFLNVADARVDAAKGVVICSTIDCYRWTAMLSGPGGQKGAAPTKSRAMVAVMSRTTVGSVVMIPMLSSASIIAVVKLMLPTYAVRSLTEIALDWM